MAVRYAGDYLKREIPRYVPKQEGTSLLQDHDSLVTFSANDITVTFRKADATIARVQKGKEGVEVPLTDGLCRWV